MNMRRSSTLLSGFLLITTSMAAVGTATAGPVLGGNYGLEAIVAIPATGANTQPNQALTGFDISFTDNRGFYYFADRSNATVDIISEKTNTLVGRAPGFVGQFPSNAVSGPDGVLVVQNGATYTLYAGDGGSTLRAFNVTNPTAPVALGTTYTGTFGSTSGTPPSPTPNTNRLDEMAFAPSSQGGNNTIFAANNADTPAYGNLISAATPISNASLIKSGIVVPGQDPGGGMEQAVWNPNTGTWFVSIPSFNGTDAGGVSQFSLTGTFINSYNFTNMGISNCGSAGLALGSNGNLVVGCNPGSGRAQGVVLNPTANGGAGSIVKTLPQVSGTDELWYDPTRNLFYLTGTDANGHRVIDVFDGTTYALLQEIDLTALGFGTANLHSVAVDPLTGDIFVPIAGNNAANTQCTLGCVAVFSVPEPPSVAIFLAGLLLAGLGMHLQLRRRSAASS
jgi:hypothetical protein